MAVPVNEPVLTGNEKKYLQECIETGWVSSEGPFVERFEQAVAAYHGRKYGVAVCNGTAALQVAVEALRLPAGSEVLLPSFTIISCAAAIVRAGLVPVAIDADPLTWNMDVRKLESGVTKNTKAIMVVHIYGLPVDMDSVRQVAERHNLAIIEDAAEEIGQTYKGKLCGSFGQVSIFSFYPNKHITTGEGGMVLTDDPDIAERSRSLRNLCFQPKQRFFHDELGYNFRITNMQAALGLAQFERLPEFIALKREHGRSYQRHLQDVPGLQLPLDQTEYAENIYWVFAIVLKDEVPFAADEAMTKLKDLGIGTRPFFYPMHQQPVFKRMGYFAGADCPVSERIARRGFYIPSGLSLNEQQIVEVVDAVKQILT